MNWNPVSNGGMTIAALVLVDVPRYAAAAATALKNAAEGIPLALKEYGAGSVDPGARDGGWPEGPGYWCFITKYLLAVSECLLTATGSDNGYYAIPGVNDTANYAMQMHNTPSRRVFNYGDSEEEHPGPASKDLQPAYYYLTRYGGNLMGLAHRFKSLGNGPVQAAKNNVGVTVGVMNASQSGAWDEIVLQLIYWNSQSSGKDLSALPHFGYAACTSGGMVGVYLRGDGGCGDSSFLLFTFSRLFFSSSGARKC